MLWIAGLIGVIIGWLNKGKLKYFNQYTIHGWGFAIASIIVQTTISFDFQYFSQILSAYYAHLYILSFVMLIIFILLQKKDTGIIIITLAISLNFLVITANQGKMPVDTSKLPNSVVSELENGTKSPFHAPVTDQTLFAFLGDQIMIPGNTKSLISLGDIFLALGITLYIPQKMQKQYRAKH